MPLHRITVYYEADDVAPLTAEIERAICPRSAAEPHECPHRWMIISAELDADEAAELDGLLNS